MKRINALLLSLCAASSFPAVSAWSFIWRNESDYPFTQHSTDPQPCTSINHAQGKEYDYNPEDDGYWIWLWTSDNCSGDTAGHSEPSIWRKNASIDLHSYLIGNENKVAVISSSTIPSATSTSATSSPSSSASSSSTPSSASSGESSSGSGSSLSGGAIAGIVIGVIAGVAILGALFFFLGRRNRQKAAAETPQQSDMQSTSPGAPGAPGASTSPVAPPYAGLGGMAAPQAGVYEAMAVPKSETGYANSPMSATTQEAYRPSRMHELVGDNGTAEMSDTHRVNELEEHTKHPSGW
ncbi:hypothetical protein ASPWEDRAFT_33922 [Aspergillus wentii DTO 134E9]|uniref:Mid2 domain-containing protein n=1 Tax=Aspergillus wentii DTO 134E9 TaxID=1073089 RepID=A0A1L9S072_ASPWE|nr:uncharacterized protein ASPWEDRAFT_33922 [Aspergillus wentii DTO 134E9]KAI9932921.1 hypothetical protein MW887_009173 [Aspergillus wentii]OJJ40507.1 hypothetical protein ASPWEDRAFT_33922 [Aspergillus wentii DTO 134E9]